MRKERIIIIFNPGSGVFPKNFASSLIYKKLRKHFENVSIVKSNSPGHGNEIAKQARDYFDIITAFGGDGTINSVASALIGSDKVLAILPGGSGNGMVRSLNIPLSWRKAMKVLIHGRDIHIDAGKINNKYFFNIAGIGLDAIMAKRYHLECKTRGMAPYVLYAFKEFLDPPSFPVKIIEENREFEEEITILAFANLKQYGGQAIIAPFARPDDRLLDMCVLNKFKLSDIPMNIKNLFSGNIHRFRFYRSFKMKKAEVKSLAGKIPFHFDGEYCGQDVDCFKIEVLPAALKLRVPPEN